MAAAKVAYTVLTRGGSAPNGTTRLLFQRPGAWFGSAGGELNPVDFPSATEHDLAVEIHNSIVNYGFSSGGFLSAGVTDDSLTRNSDSYYSKALTACMARILATGGAILSPIILAKLVSSAKYAAQTVSVGYITVGRNNTGTVNGLSYNAKVDNRRSLLLGMALVFDICYSEISQADRTIIAQGILDMCDFMLVDGAQLMDGHAGGDQACQLVGALSIYGETGFTSGGSNAATRLDEALDYWYGGNSGLTDSGGGWIDYSRYYLADGGGKGAWYEALEMWYTSYFLMAMQNGFTSLTLDGDPYAIPTNEPWIDAVGEWFLNVTMRGDFDYFQIGDTFRTSNPFFQIDTRTALSFLIQNSNTWRRQLRWMFDALRQRTKLLGQNPAYNEVFDYIAIDHHQASTQPLPPDNTIPKPSRSRLFQKSGTYIYRNNWDIIGPNNTTILITCPRYYYQGHQDLDCGAIQINVNDDMVLCSTGFYSTGDVNANYQGTHNNKWKKQSIAHSGIPLIDDLFTTQQNAPIEQSLPHTNRNDVGTHVVYAHGQGGQLWKRFGTAIDPNTINKMTSDGGALAWMRVQGINGETDRGIEIKVETDEYVFLTADIRRAYLRQYTDLGTSAERATMVEMKWVIIKNEWNHPIVFRVARVKSRLASFKKYDNWNFWGSPNMGTIGTNGRFSSIGYRADQNAPINPPGLGGKLLIAYHNFANLNFVSIGDTDPNFALTTSTKFSYSIGGAARIGYPPSGNPSSTRHYPDIGRFRIEASPKTQQVEDYFVCALVPMIPGETEPTFEFFEEQDYFGIRFTSGANARVYKVHKTQSTIIGPGNATDLTPPTVVSPVTPSLPAAGEVRLTWPALNSDPTMDNGGKYRMSYRVKV